MDKEEINKLQRAAHDIRSQLSAISLGAQMLERAPLEDNRKEVAARMLRSVDKIDAIIEAALDSLDAREVEI